MPARSSTSDSDPAEKESGWRKLAGSAQTGPKTGHPDRLIRWRAAPKPISFIRTRLECRLHKLALRSPSTGNFVHDLRYALRVFGRNPGLTAVAVLSLALGIGPNAALFSILNGLLLRPLACKDADQLVRLSVRTDKGPQILSYPDYLDLRHQVTSLSGLVAWEKKGVLLTVEGRREAVPMNLVSENYFAVLGVNAALGRLDVAGQGGEEPRVVISHNLWRRAFNADPEMAGRSILLNGRSCTVAGVAARGFRGLDWHLPIDVWMPVSALAVLAPGERADFGRRDRLRLLTMGRLRAGAAKEQAEAELTRIAGRLAEAYPETAKGRTIRLTIETKDRPGIALSAIVLSLVGLVLLIACANVAGLLLAHAETRRRETAIRLALGVRRSRLIRQLLTESAVLSVAGAALGLLLAFRLVDLAPAWKPALPLSLSYEVRIDGRVLLYTLVLSLATAVVFGLAPALRASRPDLITELKAGNGRPGGSRRVAGRTVLVIAQIAVAQLLMTEAGLLLRSYFNTQAIHPGFDASKNILLVTVGPGTERDLPRTPIPYDLLLERLRALPGVKNTSVAANLPLSGSGEGTLQVAIPGAVLPSGGETEGVRFNAVGLSYFATVGTRILWGRDFNSGDGPQGFRAVLINQTMARRFWPAARGAPEVLGATLRIEGAAHQVVGVVEDGKYGSLREAPQPFLFLPLRPRFHGDATLLVETAGDPRTLAESVRRVAAAPELTVVATMTLRQHLRLSRLLEETAAGLLGSLGLLGIFLAGVGLYGLVSYAVNRRLHEFGVRMALGARPPNVLRLVLGQGLRLASAGVGLGLVAAFIAGRVTSRLLFGVSAADPAAFTLSALAVMAIALLATQAPARRAIKVDPAVALRYE